jgi:hypothetical protein
MRRTFGALVLLVAVVSAGSATARGQAFRLEVGPPIAGNSTLVKKGKAVVAVRSLSCDPSGVTISGTAEGVVNGARRSIPLTLVPLETPGVYSVPRVWEQGRWVLMLSGACASRTNEIAATIVPLGPGGFIRDVVKVLTRAATAADIDAALRDARPDTE